jgi:hypothetical protein
MAVVVQVDVELAVDLHPMTVGELDSKTQSGQSVWKQEVAFREAPIPSPTLLKDLWGAWAAEAASAQICS